MSFAEVISGDCTQESFISCCMMGSCLHASSISSSHGNNIPRCRMLCHHCTCKCRFHGSTAVCRNSKHWENRHCETLWHSNSSDARMQHTGFPVHVVPEWTLFGIIVKLSPCLTVPHSVFWDLVFDVSTMKCCYWKKQHIFLYIVATRLQEGAYLLFNFIKPLLGLLNWRIIFINFLSTIFAFVFQHWSKKA